MKVLKVFLVFSVIFNSFAEDDGNFRPQSGGGKNSEWGKNDPRWETEIPNWWDEENFVPPVGPVEERKQSFWMDQGQKLLKEKLEQKLNLNKAKNLVIFIGDGMGLSTQMAGRAYKSDVKSELAFEKFPHSGLAKVYCINNQVPDSACTASAILSGVKNNYGTLGVSGDVNLRECSKQQDNATHVDSIFKFAQESGKATGIVTNTRITHATPAAAYAHSASRYWESNENSPDNCDDIAHQLIHGEVGSRLDVAMGGGRRHFLPIEASGRRTDARNLISEYKEAQRKQNKRFVYVEDRPNLARINAAETDKIFGLFASNHMEYKLLADTENQPTLTEMTAKALDVLRKNENGFVLLVEGGRIDHGHHKTMARLSLEETLEFEKAVEFVRKETNEEDTLIVVTADHGHVFTVGGYPPRGRNILGVGDFSRFDQKWLFTLNYANGPSFEDHSDPSGGRRNPQGMRYTDPSFRQPATVHKVEETHSGEDVGVYAVGPHSHMFTGVYEQSYIAHAVAYATCLGPESFTKHLDCTGSASIHRISLLLASTLLAFNVFLSNSMSK